MGDAKRRGTKAERVTTALVRKAEQDTLKPPRRGQRRTGAASLGLLAVMAMAIGGMPSKPYYDKSTS